MIENEPSKYNNARALAKAVEKLRSKTPPVQKKEKPKEKSNGEVKKKGVK